MLQISTTKKLSSPIGNDALTLEKSFSVRKNDSAVLWRLKTFADLPSTSVLTTEYLNFSDK